MRDFTEIERGIIASFVGRSPDLFSGACGKFAAIDPGLVVRWRTIPTTSAASPSGESLLILRFRLQVDAVEGLVDIVLPAHRLLAGARRLRSRGESRGPHRGRSSARTAARSWA